jgi:aminopeptidase N
VRLAALLLAALLAAAAPSLALAERPAAARAVLPDAVRPERYEIRVAPDAERLRFTGQVRIAVQVLRTTDTIVLNAADLEILGARLDGALQPTAISLDPKRQTAAFRFDAPLPRGAHTLAIDYAGRIYQQASGLFALDAPAAGGSRRSLFTQFENSDARRFAPLWDEPSAKAVFSLTVEAPAGQLAISNMPVAHAEILADGRRATTFADTPKMSSYLLFLALGDLERVHRKVGATDVGVVVARGQAAAAGFALDAASELLGYYNDYFATAYPLAKLDLVAGPGRSQFFGAMENWGAIFAFDRDLLVEPGASAADRQGVYVTIAHEIAHQWFGDLVTMAWWDDLWLNEGFATWMEHKATDHFHPEWKIQLQAMGARDRAMQIDAAGGSHPVITPIPDVLAASEAFDEITYQKGEAVVRMLESHIGAAAFRAGVRSYIARYAYQNTVTDDFWRELERASPRPVTQIAHDFTLQSGVPLIRAAPDRDGVSLRQDRFGRAEGGPSRAGWLTPITVQAAGGEIWTGLVSRAQPAVAPIPADRAPMVNAGQRGYFRTRYDAALWSPLTARFASLAPEDQLGLLYDSRALVQAGEGSPGDYLDLARAAAAAREPIVLAALTEGIVGIARAYPPEAGARYRAFGRARLAPVLDRIGWAAAPGEDENLTALRATLINALGGELGDPATVAQARLRFQHALGAPDSLAPGLRPGVLAVVAREATPADWDALHGLARSARSSVERDRLYALLGAARDPALAERALALALSGEPPPTTAPAILSSVAVLHPEIAFRFALAHRAAVEALLEPSSRTAFFTGLASGSSDPALADALAEFGRSVPASSRPDVARGVSAIQRRRSFADRRLPEFDRWLAAHPD